MHMDAVSLFIAYQALSVQKKQVHIHFTADFI